MDWPISEGVAARFELQKPVATHGCVDEFLAVDRNSGRLVRVQIFDRSLISADDVREFERWFAVAVQVESAYVVALLEFGEIGDHLYVTAEGFDGTPLASLVRADGWPRQDVVRVVTHVAHGLEALHAKGLARRYLSPRSVLVSGDLAKLAVPAEPLLTAANYVPPYRSATGWIAADPPYLSPEEIRGHATTAGSVAGDVFALAVMTFELVAGQLPWGSHEAGVGDVLISILENPPRQLQRAHESFGDITALRQFLERGLAKNANDRPRDPLAFLQGLERAIR